MFATEQGMVKKTSMSLYDRTRKEGLIAINLKDGDKLISVQRVAPGEQVMMVSSDGKAICFPEDEIRSMGRDTMGVRGMTVGIDSRVLGMEIAKDGTDLLVLTERGYGKRTPIAEYPPHHRGGKGVYTITMTAKKGMLAAMKIVSEDDELMVVTEEGVIVRTPVKGVSQLGRATQGVMVMNVEDGDKIIAAAVTSEDTEKRDRSDNLEPETLVESKDDYGKRD